MADVIDIISSGDYPSNVLSNFYPNEFEIDGIRCASMEGFLQSLKTKNRDKQKYICTLSGKAAKNYFRHKLNNIGWKLTGSLHWNGQRIKRTSEQYQQLIDRAYDELAKGQNFCDALLATGDAELRHSIGKSNPRFTVLTETEFIERLTALRNRLKGAKDEIHTWKDN